MTSEILTQRPTIGLAGVDPLGSYIKRLAHLIHLAHGLDKIFSLLGFEILFTSLCDIWMIESHKS